MKNGKSEIYPISGIYIWADGIYCNVRMKEKQYLLVIMGATEAMIHRLLTKAQVVGFIITGDRATTVQDKRLSVSSQTSQLLETSSANYKVNSPVVRKKTTGVNWKI